MGKALAGGRGGGASRGGWRPGAARHVAAAALALGMVAPGAAWAQGGVNGFGFGNGVNGVNGPNGADGPNGVEYVRVCDAFGEGFFYIPGTETCLRIGGRVRASNFDIDDRIGIGTAIRGVGVETFITRYDDRLTGTGGGVSASLDFGRWSHTLKGDYDRADDSVAGQIPINGLPSGYTFGTDAFGSTGIALGTTGSEVLGELDLTRYEFTYKAMRAFDPFAGLPGVDLTPEEEKRSKKKIGLVVSFERTDLEQKGWLRSLSFPNNIEIWNSHELESDAFGVGAVVSGKRTFDSGFFIRGSADLQLVYRQTDFISWEHVACDICGTLPQQFMIGIEHNEDDITYKAGLDADVGFNVSPNLSLKVGAGIDITERQAIHVRENPNDADTGIRDYTALDYNYRFTVGFRF